jgi:hypothetical protein
MFWLRYRLIWMFSLQNSGGLALMENDQQSRSDAYAWSLRKLIFEQF